MKEQDRLPKSFTTLWRGPRGGQEEADARQQAAEKAFADKSNVIGPGDPRPAPPSPYIKAISNAWIQHGLAALIGLVIAAYRFR